MTLSDAPVNAGKAVPTLWIFIEPPRGDERERA
jgi:hypothetical protein